jgi:N-acetylglucosaminyl-diphospho-decaprenol L-rhamnosyltransferase
LNAHLDLTVVIVTFNSAHCIPDLVAGLGHLKNVVFVDNNSDDGTAKTIAEKLPQAEVLCNAKNLGFGAANNRALNRAQTPYCLLLNPDCLPKPEFFDQLMEAAKRHAQAAIIAPHLIKRNGDIEISYRWPATHWVSSGPGAEAACCVGFACGAALLLNMSLVRPLGFFDEDFFLYYEDEDLCQRVFESKNQIVLIPELQVTHLSRGSVRGKHPLRSEYLRGFHHAQSKLLFEAKYFGKAHANSLRWKTLALAVLTLPVRLIVLQPRYLSRLVGRIRGLCDGAAIQRALGKAKIKI